MKEQCNTLLLTNLEYIRIIIFREYPIKLSSDKIKQLNYQKLYNLTLKKKKIDKKQ